MTPTKTPVERLLETSTWFGRNLTLIERLPIDERSLFSKERAGLGQTAESFRANDLIGVSCFMLEPLEKPAAVFPNVLIMVSDHETGALKPVQLGPAIIRAAPVGKMLPVCSSSSIIDMPVGGDKEPTTFLNLIEVYQVDSPTPAFPKGSPGAIMMAADSLKAVGVLLGCSEDAGYIIPMQYVLRPKTYREFHAPSLDAA